ncbi:hypothetical protein IT398_00340 [Candidatus Nomurabacteria bacterium]|nr:hypothetical protein [Candidatus Nomurabacteria bacterium]
MKKITKLVLTGLLVTLVIPQIALAAWWNPISWLNNWNLFKPATPEETKTQVLENRIKELEKKLEKSVDISNNPSTTTLGTKKEALKQTVRTNDVTPIESPTLTKPKPIVTQPTIVTPPLVKSIQPAQVVDIYQAKDNLMSKLNNLKSQVENIISDRGYTQPDKLSGRDYVEATNLTQIVQKLGSSLYDLKSTNPSQKSIDYHTSQYSSLETSFNSLGFNESDWSPRKTEKLDKGENPLLVQMRMVQSEIDKYKRFLLEINAGHYSCVRNDTNTCPDVYTPQNPIPQEIIDIIFRASFSATDGGDAKILTKGTSLARYVEQQIEFILFDLEAKLRQLRLTVQY